ncbi:hypothetical protein DFH28DRAFT_393523 [Melampsora americana]|nr:hypothetical protein DFH28DRAFT_393523 [Melampsora americana]
MKQTVYDCVPGYQKHLEEVKLKKSKERHPKDLLASTATQPKVEIEGMPPNGLVSARKFQYESLSSNQPANSQQHPASAMEIDTDIINIDPPHLPRNTTPHVKTTTRVVPEQSPAPLCESTSNNLTAINNDELSPRKKRRRVVDHVDDHPEDSRVQTIQMKGHSKKTPMKFYSGGTSRTPRQPEDISMSEATGSPAEEVQRPHEAARTPASECGSTRTPPSGSVHLSADIDGDPLDNLHSYRSSPPNEIELRPAIQDKIENGQLITTPMPNQAVTPDMSPTDQGGINSSAPVGFSESSQSRNSTRRTSNQHQNSIESSLEAPFVSDAERTRNNKQRRDPQMPYQAARAIDQQQLQNSIYNKKPTGEPNDPIPLD